MNYAVPDSNPTPRALRALARMVRIEERVRFGPQQQGWVLAGNKKIFDL